MGSFSALRRHVPTFSFAVARYRLRAASYGTRLRLRHPDLFGRALAVAGLILAVILAVHLQTVPEVIEKDDTALRIAATATSVVIVAALGIYRLGSLDHIMGAASRNNERARQVRDDMALGMLNPGIYRLLTELYRPAAETAWAALGYPPGRFGQDAMPTDISGNAYAVVCFPSSDHNILRLPCRAVGRHRLAREGFARNRRRLVQTWREIPTDTPRRRPLVDSGGDNYACMSIDRTASARALRPPASSRSPCRLIELIA